MQHQHCIPHKLASESNRWQHDFHLALCAVAHPSQEGHDSQQPHKPQVVEALNDSTGSAGTQPQEYDLQAHVGDGT